MPNAAPRWHVPAVGLVLFAGAALRFSALGQGIPFALGIDEPEIMERAVRVMKTGEFHPHFFDYPSLYIYLQAVVAAIRFATGAMAGEWSHLTQAPPAEFYLWGRAVTATLGTATILIVYLAGRRISPRVGLIASVLFAVQSLHVRESHFVLTDVPATFFVTLTWLLSLRAVEATTIPDGRMWPLWAWTGVAVGAAAATKYNGGVAVLLPAFALLLAPVRWSFRLRALAATAAATGVTFLVCAPYTVLALPEFLNAFGHLAYMYAEGVQPPEAPWLTYLKHLRNNFSILAMALAGVGLIAGATTVARQRRTTAATAWALSASFVLLYFWMISGQRLVWGRYILPLLPFACVLAAGGIDGVAAWVGRRWQRSYARTLAAAMLVVAASVQPAWNSVSWLNTQSKVSTLELAYRWILEHVPEGSKVATETREVLLPAERYDLGFPRRLISYRLEDYQREGFDYLLASSQSFQVAFYQNPPDAAALVAYRELFGRSEHVITFMPDEHHPGPELRVYRVPKP